MRSGWLAAIVALTLPGTAQAATPVFAPIERTALPTNANPSIRFGKLNADARPDFVTARWEGGTQNAIVIGRSSPGGGFDITTLSPQQGLSDPAIGDINGDGRGDIVHLGSGGVRYLLQAADGTFAGPDQGFGGSGWQLRFANLNGDARADVLIGGSSTMTRFLGTANGLSTAQTIAAPGPFTVADVDADGYDDIAYLNAPSGNNFLTVGLRLNDTTGGFRDASTFHLNRRGEQIYVTDTNSDGHQDVVVTDRIDGTAVLLGGPTFTLGNPQLFARRDDNYESIMADVDEDGRQDIVVSANHLPGILALVYYPGDGEGGFGDRRLLSSGVRATAVFAEDLNADGHIDLGVIESGEQAALAVARRLVPGFGFGAPAPGFANQVLGTIGAAQRVTVTNTGEAPLELGTLKVAGAQADAFLTTADGCAGATLAPQATCGVGVRFAPTVQGDHVATLVVRDMSAKADRTIALSGVGTAVSAAPGPSGAQGPVGTPGPTGATGAQGPAGTAGATGSPGVTGPRGADGARGRDARVSCKLSGSGKKAKVKCTVTYARASAVLTARLRVGGRTVATRKVRIRDGRGSTSFPFERGKRYRVVLS